MLSSIREDGKLPFLFGIVFIVIIAGFTLYWVLKKDYQPLFAALQPEDTAVMAQQLDKIEANYRINKNSGELEVPASDVHGTRLKLMSSDLSLNGSVGYEVFDNSDFGMTEFAQKINFQRALEGELQRTITSLEQVKFVRVHLVMPDRELFRDTKQEPTASVTLLLQDGFSLKSEEITGIQRLVSASVPKLKENMVTISDHNGQTLTQSLPTDEAGQMVPWQLQQKINAETYLVSKIQKVLGKAFNIDQVSISVNMDMDYSQVKKIEETVIPVADGRAISREKQSSVGNQSSKKGGQNITKETEYEMGKSIAEIVESPGRITNINIGVMLPVVLQEERMQQIKQLIEVTAGINAGRGDSVAIYSYDAQKVVVDVVQDSMFTSQVDLNTDALATTDILDSNMIISDEAELAWQASKTNAAAVIDDGQLVIELLKKYWFYAVFALFIMVALIIVLLSITRRDGQKKLNEDEREKVLMQLQHWLSEAR